MMVCGVIKYLIDNSIFYIEQLNLVCNYFVKNSWLGFALVSFVIIIWFIKTNIDNANNLYLCKINFGRLGVNISKNIFHKQFKYFIYPIVR